MMPDIAPAEEVDSGARCGSGHRIWLVAEGYGYCVDDRAPRPEFFAWRFSSPSTSEGIEKITGCTWRRAALSHGKGAWVQSGYSYAKQDVLDGILADIEAHRNLPFDEGRERARLMPV